MLCKESGNIRQREDYLPSLVCPYALQRKWKHQAERRLPTFTSLSLCSAKKVETSGREKTTYLHFSVPMLCKESGNIRQREDYLPSLLCPYALQRKWKHQTERRLPTFTSLSLQIKWKQRRLPTFTSLSLCSAKKVETSGREKTTYLHFSVPMLCKESGNIRQREDYLPSLLCPYALQRKWKHQAERRLPTFTSLSLCSAKKVETSSKRRLPTFTSLSLCSAKKVETSSIEKTTYLHFSVPMLCKESGNIKHRDYLPSLLCPYALQRKWKHQSREKTTYLHFSVPMLCKESGNIRQREDYLPSLLCPYALQRKWKHQAERRLPTFTSLSLCSAKKVETSGREKTTYLHFSVPMLCK